MDKKQSTSTEQKPSINSLKDLRRELRKIDAGVKIHRYSDFKAMNYVFKGKELSGNVFSAYELERLKPLIDFVNEYQDEIRKIAIVEELVGSKKFVKGR